MWKDEIVEEVRRVREEYAAQFGYDLDAIVRDLQERQAQNGHEIVVRSPRRLQTDTEGKSAQRAQGVGQGR